MSDQKTPEPTYIRILGLITGRFDAIRILIAETAPTENIIGAVMNALADEFDSTGKLAWKWTAIAWEIQLAGAHPSALFALVDDDKLDLRYITPHGGISMMMENDIHDRIQSALQKSGVIA